MTLVTKSETYEFKKKVSITIDSDIESKLRKIQSRYIDSIGENCNLSMLINLVLATGLVATKRLKKEDWRQIRSILEGKKIPFDCKTAKEYVEKLTS